MAKLTTTKIKNSSNPEDLHPTAESIQSKIDHTINFIEKNSRILAMGFFGLLLGCAIYFGWSYFSNKETLKTFDNAFKIEMKVDEFAKQDAKIQNTKDEKTPESDPNLFAKVNTEVTDFLKANPNHSASRNLALKWSGYLYNEEKYEDALTILSLYKTTTSRSLDGLAELAKASTLIQLSKYNQAIETYKKIIAEKTWKFLHPEARFQMSLAYVGDKNTPEAISNLKAIETEHAKQTKTVSEALKIKRWLQYKKAETKTEQ